MWEWPSSFVIKTITVPASSKCVAYECLNPWIPAFLLIPALFIAFLNTACALRVVFGRQSQAKEYSIFCD